LIHGRGDLETLVQDGALTLKAHILGPLDETRQVTPSRTNVSTDLVGTRTRGEERIRSLLVNLGLGVSLLLSSFLGGLLVRDVGGREKGEIQISALEFPLRRDIFNVPF